MLLLLVSAGRLAADVMHDALVLTVNGPALVQELTVGTKVFTITADGAVEARAITKIEQTEVRVPYTSVQEWLDAQPEFKDFSYRQGLLLVVNPRHEQLWQLSSRAEVPIGGAIVLVGGTVSAPVVGIAIGVCGIAFVFYKIFIEDSDDAPSELAQSRPKESSQASLQQATQAAAGGSPQDPKKPNDDGLCPECRRRGKSECAKRKYVLGKTTGYTSNPKTDLDDRCIGKTFDMALDDAAKKLGMQRSDFIEIKQWAQDKYGKSHPVKWEAANGAVLEIHDGHTVHGPDIPHIGYHSANFTVSGHVFVDEIVAHCP